MDAAAAPLADDLASPLLRLLLKLREAGGGDLEVHIILLAITQRHVAHADFRALSNKRRLAPDAPSFPTLGVNARSIADSTGIPRETVRRKIAALVRAGWIVRAGRSLTFTSEAYRALTAAREEIEQLALTFHDVVAERRP